MESNAHTWLHFAFDAISLEQTAKVKSDASGNKRDKLCCDIFGGER
jgi:hypothetical protein